MDRQHALQRLYPRADGAVAVAEAYGSALGSVDRGDGGDRRPWVGLCMVTSIDGSTVVGGRSRSLSNPVDAAVLGQLRELADVVLVGAGTVRAEGYGAPVAGQRIGVVTRTGNGLDAASPLFASGAGFFVTLDDTVVPDGIDAVRAGATSIDLRAAMHRLDDVCPTPPEYVSVEGGAQLNGALYEAGLLDELNLTMSAHVAGGDGPRLLSGAPAHLDEFELRQLCVDHASFVYQRWVRRDAGRPR